MRQLHVPIIKLRSWQALQNITPEDTTKIIQHTHKLMDHEWLKSNAAGSLKRYGSIDAPCRMTKAQREQCTDLNLEGDDLVGDDFSTRENQVPRAGSRMEEGV
jgi:hypothetical protein